MTPADDPDALGLVRLAGRAEFACTQHAMKTVVWIARLWVLAVLAAPAEARERAPRGEIVATSLTGEVRMEAGGKRVLLAKDDHVPAGASLLTGKDASVTLALSNGARVVLAGDSELAVQHFSQDSIGAAFRAGELKREPSVSRVLLLLMRGDLAGRAPALNHEGGSRFAIGTLGGELVVVAPDANAGPGENGVLLPEATLAAFQARGFRVGAGDGSAVFRVQVWPTLPGTSEIRLSNGGGNLTFVITAAGGATMKIPESRELEMTVRQP